MIEIAKYLTEQQLADYIDYVNLRQQAFAEDWHHWQRIARSRSKVTPVEVQKFYTSIPTDSLPFFAATVELGQIVMDPDVSPELDNGKITPQ